LRCATHAVGRKSGHNQSLCLRRKRHGAAPPIVEFEVTKIFVLLVRGSRIRTCTKSLKLLMAILSGGVKAWAHPRQSGGAILTTRDARDGEPSMARTAHPEAAHRYPGGDRAPVRPAIPDRLPCTCVSNRAPASSSAILRTSRRRCCGMAARRPQEATLGIF
jgi:hypothetical protein